MRVYIIITHYVCLLNCFLYQNLLPNKKATIPLLLTGFTVDAQLPQIKAKVSILTSF